MVDSRAVKKQTARRLSDGMHEPMTVALRKLALKEVDCANCQRPAQTTRAAEDCFLGLPAGWLFAIASASESHQPLLVTVCSASCAQAWSASLSATTH